ncbi:MAG TPA: hypothetical protein VFH80_04470 [Solirubrobacteraceae bacterium]|nr:hypothetical protein [Solirubrobacteraceae bacterium]
MRRLIALGVVGVVLLVLVIAQLVLPGIATNVLRDQLSKSGTVLSVSVRAFPAVELLWGQADSVVVRMGRYQAGASEIGNKLGRAADVGSLDVSAQVVQSGVLTLRNARLRKQGNELIGSATVMQSDLRAAVPFLDDVQPVASSDGQLVLRGTASLLGLNASVDAVVAARNGALVVAPDVPFGGIATITLLDDPHVRVQSVSAVAVPGGFKVRAEALIQ